MERDAYVRHLLKWNLKFVILILVGTSVYNDGSTLQCLESRGYERFDIVFRYKNNKNLLAPCNVIRIAVMLSCNLAACLQECRFAS